MIEIKTIKGIELQYDTETKLYLNPVTNKWIKQPRFQKGNFVNKAKGKKKGDTYLEKLKEIDPIFYKSTFFIPYGITDEMILNAFDAYTEYDNFNIEIGYLVITHIYIQYQHYHISKRKYLARGSTPNPLYKKIKYKLNHKYVEIPSTTWKKLLGCGDEYIHYLNAFIQSGIIETNGIYSYKYSNNRRAKCYKLPDNYIIKNENGKYYRSIIAKDPKVIYKLYEYKQLFKYNQTFLTKSTDKLFQYVDENYTDIIEKNEKMLYFYYKLYEIVEDERHEKLKLYVKNNKKISPDNLHNIIIHIKETKLYFNEKDSFGERFHSPFTNLPSIIKNFIIFPDGKHAMELDIKNSQMAFFALMFKYPNQLKTILSEFVDVLDDLHKQLKYNDVQMFVEKALDGTLYEYIGSILDENRSTVKENMFRFVFSKKHEFAKDKIPYFNIIPNVLNICYIYNSNKTIPKMCQRLESRIMIRRLFNKLESKTEYPISTIHDSIIFHPIDLHVIENRFIEIFNELKIEIPKYKITDYETYIENKLKTF